MTEATQTIEQTYLNFPSERFPLSSLAAHDTYRTFWEKTHQIDNSEKNRQAIERWEAIAVETNRILNAFCGVPNRTQTANRPLAVPVRSTNQ